MVKLVKLKKKLITKKKKFNRKKYTKKQIMRGGSIDEFLEKFKDVKKNNTNGNIIEIGRGSTGIVYLDKNQKNSVFKVSKNNLTCRSWSDEAKIYEKINTYNIDTKLCKLIKMKNYKSDDKMCIMELTRAFNPKGQDKYYTIQPHFQYDELNYLNKGRGHFLGIKELEDNEIIKKDKIESYINDLAIIMARLHYQIKNDGYDIELFISKEKEEQACIYIGDFDLSQFYDKPDIDRLSWCFMAVPYFPIEGKLYDIFSSIYIEEAAKHGMEETAKEVMATYVE